MKKPPIPIARDAISSSWVHQALVLGGLTDCPPIEKLDFEDIAANVQGEVSDTFRIRIAYRHNVAAPGPETVIVKLPTQKRNVRRTSRLMSVYAVECEFYMRIAARTPIAAPALLYGDFDKRDHSFVLILADLGDMELVDFMDGASPEQAMSAIRSVARLHATFWDREESPILSQIPKFASLWRRTLIQLYYLTMLGRALDRFGDILSGDLRRLAESYGSRLADHFADVAAEIPRTLIHGDFRTSNLFFGSPGSDEITVIDWQLASMHSGLYDIAFFLINSVSAEVRREIERPVLREYHHIICAEGGADITFQQCWQAYRGNILAILMPLVVGCGVVDITDRRLAAGMDLLLRRLATAIEDLDAAELLPSPRFLLSPARIFSILSISIYRMVRAIRKPRRDNHDGGPNSNGGVGN